MGDARNEVALTGEGSVVLCAADGTCCTCLSAGEDCWYGVSCMVEDWMCCSCWTSFSCVVRACSRTMRDNCSRPDSIDGYVDGRFCGCGPCAFACGSPWEEGVLVPQGEVPLACSPVGACEKLRLLG